MLDRVRTVNDHAVADGPVVYWMTSQRRLTWNHALDHAISRAKDLGAGLVVLEPLRVDYPYACSRFHTFVQQGMVEHAAACRDAGVAYHPYLEPTPGAGKGLLAAYAASASLIVADDHPGFFFPQMLAAAARLPVRVEAVDSIGVLPLAATDKAYVSAYQFRRFLHKTLVPHLLQRPSSQPLQEAPGGKIPLAVLDRWPVSDVIGDLTFPIADIPPVADTPGGHQAAAVRLDALVSNIDRYPERNHPDAHAESRLSPYLHFGHIAAAEVVWSVLDNEDWHPGRLGAAKGQRAGWWGLSEGAEAFLDQVITWRELGHVEARHNPRWQDYDSLPGWAQETLAVHQGDRAAPYALEVLEGAGTDDEVWNAAQRQLLREGVIHNYLRMLWGKKILEWAPDAPTALAWMSYLNDKYALDGRDPNSVSGIFWCLGRYDRPWQERAVFGKVRCMTSANTKRKLRLDGYMATWGDRASAGQAP